MRPRLLVFVVTLGLIRTVDAQGQNKTSGVERPLVFQSQLNLVRFDVVAADVAGRPVADLKSDEIQILENGVPQEIAQFAAINQEADSVYRPELDDVASNARADEGRLLFLILDDANALRSRTAFIKDAAKRLVERLTPQDWIGMLWVGPDRKGAVEFTRDRDSILRAIERFAANQSQIERWVGPDDLPSGLTKLLPQQMETDLPVGAERSLAGTANLRAMHEAERPLLIIKGVSEQLRSIEARRRVVVYIGQGARRIHTQLDPGPGLSPLPDLLLPNSIDAAKDANVTFYAIDVSDPAKRDASGPSRREGTQIRELASVSASTGGVASSYADPVAAADRVISDTSLYYLLGYVARPAGAKEQTRHIEVKTTRAGVRIFAQKSYVPRPMQSLTTHDEAARSVSGLIPRHDLPLRAFAAPFADPRQKKHAIAVAVEIALPERSSPDDRFADDLEMTILAAAPVSGVRARESVKAHVSLEAPKARGFTGHYVVCARIAVDPGQYQLRIGARSAAAGRVGSVYLDVNVPDFNKADLSLSGLAIGQSTARDRMPVARRREIADLMPFTPSLTRDFRNADRAWAFARVYRGKNAGASAVRVTTNVVNLDTGRAIWTSLDTNAVDFGNHGQADYRVDLPLSSLPAGAYRLRVEATSPTSGSIPTYRELDFRVAAN